MIRNYSIFSILFILLLIFQNCGLKSGLFSEDNLTLNNNSEGGVGYDGKLTFAITYKEKVFYTNEIKIYSGESIKIDVIGGVEPYQFNIQGPGFFEGSSQTYTASYYSYSPALDTILVTDDNGSIGVVKVEVLSFTGSSKLQYPLPGTLSPQTRLQSLQPLNENLIFSLSHSFDFQQKPFSILRSSVDIGASWNTVKVFENEQLILSVNKKLESIYMYNSNFTVIYYSDDFGKSWTKINPNINNTKIAYEERLEINRFYFVNSSLMFAYGAKIINRNTRTWLVLKSLDGGLNWEISDNYIYKNSSNIEENAIISDLIYDNQNSLYSFGILGVPGQTKTYLKIRKSDDFGQTWIDDFSLPNSNSINFSPTSAGNLVVNGNKEVFFTASSKTDVNQKEFWTLYKKELSNPTWIQVINYSYLSGARQSQLASNEKGELFLSGFGFNSTITDLEKSSRYLILKSDVNINNWTLVSDTPLQENYISKNLYSNSLILNGNKFLLSASYLDQDFYSKAVILTSNISEVLWEIKDEFSFLSQVGGNFTPRDLLYYDKNNLFMIGSGADPQLQTLHQWVVMHSSDLGKNWSVVDSYKGEFIYGYARPFGSSVFSITKGKDGKIYVSGKYTNYLGSTQFVVRSSSDLGKTWKTIDDYRSPLFASNFGYSNASGIEILDTGEILALGSQYGRDSSTSKYDLVDTMFVRSSTNQGADWNTLSQFSLSGSQEALKLKRCNDNIFLLSKVSNRYILRRSKDKGISWNELSLPLSQIQDVLLNLNVSIVKDIVCLSENQVQLFFYSFNEMATDRNGTSTQLVVAKSVDSGDTWSLNKLNFLNSDFETFIPEHVILDKDFYWLSGYLRVYPSNEDITMLNSSLGNYRKHLSVIRTKIDFTQSFIVDKMMDIPEVSVMHSNALLMKACHEGFCIIGNKSNLNLLENSALFRYVPMK